MELSSPVIDTTNRTVPVITVLVVVNGAVVGRMPLFALVTPAGLSTPYPINAGTVQLTGIQLNLTSQIANELNALLGANVIPAGFPAGTESQYTVFAAPSGR